MQPLMHCIYQNWTPPQGDDQLLGINFESLKRHFFIFFLLFHLKKKKDVKRRKKSEIWKSISNIQRVSKHPKAGRNTQQLLFSCFIILFMFSFLLSFVLFFLSVRLIFLLIFSFPALVVFVLSLCISIFKALCLLICFVFSLCLCTSLSMHLMIIHYAIVCLSILNSVMNLNSSRFIKFFFFLFLTYFSLSYLLSKYTKQEVLEYKGGKIQPHIKP